MAERQARIWRDAQGLLHIDVRGLPAPQPLLATLRLLESMQPPEPLVFVHDRDPQLLYPELLERAWTWERVQADADAFRLMLMPPPSDSGADA